MLIKLTASKNLLFSRSTSINQALKLAGESEPCVNQVDNFWRNSVRSALRCGFASWAVLTILAVAALREALRWRSGCVGLAA